TLPFTEASKLFLGGQNYFDKGEPARLYRGKGCESCNGTGYKGRVGIYELLIVTQQVEQLIVARASSSDLNNVAREQGMKHMFDDGFAKVKAGMTTIDELLRVAAPPDLIVPHAKE
ncbi:MAG: hypothetical protein AAB728_05835, partial [Patescibacteria group bacterium]